MSTVASLGSGRSRIGRPLRGDVSSLRKESAGSGSKSRRFTGARSSSLVARFDLQFIAFDQILLT
jgi:hypothetical protein